MKELISSFRRIPPSAIPATLDCILASTTYTPSSLFSLLLDAPPPPLQHTQQQQQQPLDDDHSNHISSYVAALCHLLKKPGLDAQALHLFVSTVLIPLITTYDHRHDNNALSSFLDLVIETNAWGVVQQTMLPYFLNSHSTRILASILDASLKAKHLPQTDGCNLQTFTRNLVSDIANLTLQMLLQTPQYRSCAITVFLPLLFQTISSDVSVDDGHEFVLFRKNFLAKIWKCCKDLFVMGSSERRDAYTILSLYVSCSSESQVSGNDFVYDLRADKEFWDQMKKGLVDKEHIVRKQSLHILKSTAMTCETKQKASVLETVSNETKLNSNGLTKRERWANKEAKTLGIDNLCVTVDSDSTSQCKWGAFFLLYEMLEEYGTHLVEAAWNHQTNLLLNASCPSDSPVNLVGERISLDPFETLEDMFDWLAVLWQRGLCHDNP